MKVTRRGFLRGLMAAVAVATTSAAASVSRASAADLRPRTSTASPTAESTAGWEPLPLTDPVARLFAPSSGALLASTSAGLMRSDDAGVSWRQITLPGDGRAQSIDVDPTDHRVVFAATTDGLHRSDDEGLTWTLLLPSTLTTLRVAVSPASAQVLYVAQASTTGAFAFRRSMDRGATWDTLEETTQAPCGWSVPILQPHPTDANRLFRTSGCYAGRDLGDTLEQSRDAGATFSTLFTAKTAFPYAIVGGGGAEPNRLYVAANNDFRLGGSLVVTSSDDGATWSPILTHTGGGTMTGAAQPSTVITGLTYGRGGSSWPRNGNWSAVRSSKRPA